MWHWLAKWIGQLTTWFDIFCKSCIVRKCYLAFGFYPFPYIFALAIGCWLLRMFNWGLTWGISSPRVPCPRRSVHLFDLAPSWRCYRIDVLMYAFGVSRSLDTDIGRFMVHCLVQGTRDSIFHMSTTANWPQQHQVIKFSLGKYSRLCKDKLSFIYAYTL